MVNCAVGYLLCSVITEFEEKEDAGRNQEIREQMRQELGVLGPSVHHR